MNVNYPYSLTITMRRSRQNIIEDSFQIQDPTSRIKPRSNTFHKNYQKVLGKNERLPKNLYENISKFYSDPMELRPELFISTPEWRRLDKSRID